MEKRETGKGDSAGCSMCSALLPTTMYGKFRASEYNNQTRFFIS